MVAAGAFGLRVQTVREGLSQARNAIRDVEALDAELGKRLRVRVELETKNLEQQLASADVSDRTSTAELLEQSENLIAMTLEFLGGAAARHLGYDGGITSLALAWLDQLSDDADLPRVGVVIPAATEFTDMLTEVIRLRVPSDGIWSLPVAVHEYGHFVASELTKRVTDAGMPRTVAFVEKLLHKRGSDAELPRLYWHGHELFADALASATAGPAYTHYWIRYRLDPEKAQEPADTHPAPARRLRLQFAVLDRLATNDGSGYLTAEVDTLRTMWAAIAQTVGQPTDVPKDQGLDSLEEELIKLIFNDKHLVAIRYGDHVAACALADVFLEQASQPSQPRCIAQVLNAAWCRRARLEQETSDLKEFPKWLEAVADRAGSLVRSAAASRAKQSTSKGSQSGLEQSPTGRARS